MHASTSNNSDDQFGDPNASNINRAPNQPSNEEIEDAVSNLNDMENFDTHQGNEVVSANDRLSVEILEIRTLKTPKLMLNNRVEIRKAVLGLIKPQHEPDQNVSLLDIMYSFKLAVDTFLSSALQYAEDDDLIQVVIKTPKLKHHISTSMMAKRNFSVQYVLAVVQSKVQSDFDLSIGDGITIDVIIVKKKSKSDDIRASGFFRYRHHKAGSQRSNWRTSVVRISNTNDSMCLARAIAVLLSHYMTNNSISSQLDIIWKQITTHKNKQMDQWKYDAIKRGDACRRIAQREIAINLCNLINVSTQSACGISEVKLFEAKLSVCIKIIAEDAFNTFVYKGRKFEDPVPCLYLLRRRINNGKSFHFDAITNIKTYFPHPFYCIVCDEPHWSITSHRCQDITDWCYTCYNRNCINDVNYAQHNCSICDRNFRSNICEKNHSLLAKERCFEVVCNLCYEHIPRRKKRKIQNVITYETNAEVLKRHKPCTSKCSVCMKSNISADHYCYMQQRDFLPHISKVVYLDFETRQETGQHFPVFCYLKWKFDHSDTGITEIGEHQIGISMDITDDVGDFLFSKKFENSTIVAHNMRGFDGFFLIQYLITHNMKPRQVILNGTKLITCIVPHFRMRIIDSLNFLPMTLAEMPKAFNINEDGFRKGYFPLFFIHPNNFSYLGPIPDKEYFGYDAMKKKQQEEFDVWYSDQIEKNIIFDFDQEMIVYCKQDVEILYQGFEKFRELVKDLTSALLRDRENLSPISTMKQKLENNEICLESNLWDENTTAKRRKLDTIQSNNNGQNVNHDMDSDLSDTDDDDEEYVLSHMGRRRKRKNKNNSKIYHPPESCDPLSYVTLAGLCHGIFKTCFLQSNTIAVISPGGYQNHRYSNKQIEWLEYQRLTDTPDILHYINNGKECKIGKYFVDGYSPVKNCIYEFYGCFFHGHKTCIQNMGRINPVAKVSFNTLYFRTISREADLKAAGYELHTIWECEWEKFKKDQGSNNIILNDILKRAFTFTPLNPREAFRGGRTETCKLFSSPGTLLKYVDVNSLYPYILLSKMFPVGHPKIIIANFDLSLNTYFGFVKCFIVPPRKLYHPVLPLSCNGKLLFPLCRSCAENCQTSKCTHDDAESRGLYGTWFTEEIKLAVQLGYKIHTIYQIMHFEEKSSDLFKGYVQAFYKLKLMASGIPSHIEDNDLSVFLSDIENHDGIHLTESDLQNPNPARRWLTKIMLNCFYGRFGMREDKAISEFITSEEDLDRIMTNSLYTISALLPQTESVALISYKYSSSDIIPMSNQTNIYIAAATTAWARMELYKYLDQCTNEDKSLSRVYYCDTDSVIYAPSDKKEENPIEGLHLGQLTNELKDDEFISFFVSGGPKNYAYQTTHGNECMKVKGFSLNATNRSVFSVQNMSDIIHYYIAQNDLDGRVQMPYDRNIINKNKQNRIKLMEQHQSSGSKTIYDQDSGAISCWQKTKIVRDISSWQLLSKEEQRYYKFFFNKRVITSSQFDTFPFGY